MRGVANSPYKPDAATLARLEDFRREFRLESALVFMYGLALDGHTDAAISEKMGISRYIVRRLREARGIPRGTKHKLPTGGPRPWRPERRERCKAAMRAANDAKVKYRGDGKSIREILADAGLPYNHANYTRLRTRLKRGMSPAEALARMDEKLSCAPLTVTRHKGRFRSTRVTEASRAS